MKRRLLMVLVLPLAASALAWLKLRPSPAAGPDGPAAGAGPLAPAPLVVQVMTVQPVPFAESINVTGTLRAEEAVELQVESAGKVSAILFQEGTPVRRGDLLLKINDADLQATLQRAIARRQLAEIRERRLALLVREGGANQQDYDAAASELQVQGAEVRLIEAEIAKKEIRAPFDGIVGLRAVSEGSYVSPTTRIGTLQNVATLKLDFAIPEKYALQVRPGQPLTFIIAGDPTCFAAEVFAIEPRIDESTRTLLLRARAANPAGRLRPGAFASVDLEITNETAAILVPSTAIVPGLVDKHVYLLRDGQALRRTVQPGARTEAAVQILAGLVPGDVVITSGVQSLRPGLRVAARTSTADASLPAMTR